MAPAPALAPALALALASCRVVDWIWFSLIWDWGGLGAHLEPQMHFGCLSAFVVDAFEIYINKCAPKMGIRNRHQGFIYAYSSRFFFYFFLLLFDYLNFFFFVFYIFSIWWNFLRFDYLFWGRLDKPQRISQPLSGFN